MGAGECFSLSTPELIGAGLTLWKAGTYNSKGQVLTQTLGQGVTTQTNYFPITDEVNSHQATHPSAGLIQHKSYTWQPNGNLQSRSDHLVKRQQSFGYDKLNRIDTVSTTALSGSTISTLPPPEKYDYDPNGNLRFKKSGGTAYASLQYDSSRPHAVTSALIRGEQRTYDYDADGNVISDGKRTFTYSSGNQLKTLSYTSAPSLKSLNFENPSEFHPLGQRIECRFEFNASQSRSFQLKQRISSPADGSVVMHEERTRYLGSYEREIHHRRASPAANLELEKTLHRHTLPGGTIYTRSISPSGNLTTAKLTTVLSDHLGSTDVLLVSAWNGNGWASPLIERQAFNSWGERANAQTWENARNAAADPYRTSAQDYDRGYTGHEQLDDSGLIHMNGRIYDPELGRMLGADPIVQLPEFSQNLNRYSYVLNNPLNATDPSGYSWLSKAFKKIGNWLKENWRTVVSIVFTFVLFFVLGPAGGWLMGALKGFLSGAFNAAIHGGGVKDILRGAVVGAIQGGLSAGLLHGMEPSSFGLKEAFQIESMKHIAGHGIVGGLASEAMGGKFQDGFVAAASAAFASNAGLLGPAPTDKDGFIQVAQRTAAAAVVGGTAAALGGGKFGNGAWTAAFQHLLNSERDYIGKMFEPLTAMTKPLQNWLNPPVYDVQMELIYDKNPTSKLTVKTANGNREFMVFSGTGNYRNDPAYEGVQNIGPAPRGKYYITDRPSGRIPNPFKMRWFALYRDDGKVNDVTYVGNIKRSTIRMHPGSVSKGCITFSGNDFSEVRGILIDSGTRNIPGTNIPYYGILNIK